METIATYRLLIGVRTITFLHLIVYVYLSSQLCFALV
jgi:hypothetical protein